MKHQNIAVERAEGIDGHPLDPFVGLFWGTACSAMLWIALILGVMALVNGR
jgi:hypothetical protein